MLRFHYILLNAFPVQSVALNIIYSTTCVCSFSDYPRSTAIKSCTCTYIENSKTNNYYREVISWYELSKWIYKPCLMDYQWIINFTELDIKEQILLKSLRMFDLRALLLGSLLEYFAP